MKDYKENLKRIIEVSKIDCCPGCGLTLEGLEQIISERESEQKRKLWEFREDTRNDGYGQYVATIDECIKLITNTK